jgi:hypothetical protein
MKKDEVMHNNREQQLMGTYSIKNFVPLISIFIVICAFTLIKQLVYGFDIRAAMYDYMGATFLIFGSFKIINIRAFADAYSTYDSIAKHIKLYAYIYPWIEIMLGIAYVMRYQLMLVNSITLVLMSISSIGVIQALFKKQTIACACLGMVFTLPMTYVTLLENISMGLMALWMIVRS